VNSAAPDAGAVFSAAHIAFTASVTALFALLAAGWRLGRAAWTDVLGITVATGASVYLWRISANMPALNTDGLPGFSANDWLAPVLTYVFLSVYAALRPPADTRRFDQTRALATVASLAVNVITI
jgi:hypothetical protein